jgi:hypothetical protein
MQWWRRRDAPIDTVSDAEVERVHEADLERAYEKGRMDERLRHRSHPILAALLFVAAVVGVGMIYLAAHEGSFSRGGAVVDQKLATAADKTQVASQDAAVAAVNAGQTVQDAGQTLRENSVQR